MYLWRFLSVLQTGSFAHNCITVFDRDVPDQQAGNILLVFNLSTMIFIQCCFPDEGHINRTILHSTGQLQILTNMNHFI